MIERSMTHEELLADQLRDPDFRAYWERTAFARAVAVEVIKYRVEHGLSQRALASQLGVSQAVVGRLELGEHEPRTATLRNLAQNLGMRFLLEIHPTGQPDQSMPIDDGTIERVTVDGVDLLVRAS
jgi:transcriptional regulator with XRE-family HTH domain